MLYHPIACYMSTVVVHSSSTTREIGLYNTFAPILILIENYNIWNTQFPSYSSSTRKWRKVGLLDEKELRLTSRWSGWRYRRNIWLSMIICHLIWFHSRAFICKAHRKYIFWFSTLRVSWCKNMDGFHTSTWSERIAELAQAR